MPPPMIEDSDISAETVRSFAAHMSATFGASVGRTPDLVAGALSVMGFDSTQTAVAVGRNVYLPVPIGVRADGWSQWDQVSVITHEMQHVDQGHTRGLLAHTLDYVLRTSGRTHSESQAMASQMELEMWRRGTVADWWPRVHAQALRTYMVRPADLEVSRRYLLALAPTVRRSGFVTPAGRAAIRWLDLHAPELRHPSVPSRAAS